MFGKKQPGSNLPVPTSSNFVQRKSAGDSVETVRLDHHPLFSQAAMAAMGAGEAGQVEARFTDSSLETGEYVTAKNQLIEALLDKIDFGNLRALSDDMKKDRVREAANFIIYQEIKVPLTASQIELLK